MGLSIKVTNDGRSRTYFVLITAEKAKQKNNVWPTQSLSELNVGVYVLQTSIFLIITPSFSSLILEGFWKSSDSYWNLLSTITQPT